MTNYRTWDASDGNYMVINGVRYPVINSNVSAPPDYTDRLAWTIVTEGHEDAEEQSAAPADATAVPQRCGDGCSGCAYCTVPGHIVDRPTGGLFITGNPRED